MDLVNVYGPLQDGSSLIITAGNYNTIHGILCQDLEIHNVSEIQESEVLELRIKYENPLFLDQNNVKKSLLFSLEDVHTGQFVSVTIEIHNGKKMASACLSEDKAIFSLDYSNLDKNPRSNLLAGVLYSLETTFGDQTYTVNWKIKNFVHGDLIIFIPTVWYESSGSSESSTSSTYVSDASIFCHKMTGLPNLLTRLNQLSFKGYTSEEWCQYVPDAVNCSKNELCGECMGRCVDPNLICYPSSQGEGFVCGLPSLEPDFRMGVTFVQESSTPQTSGGGAVWFAIAFVVIITVLLVWGVSQRPRVLQTQYHKQPRYRDSE